MQNSMNHNRTNLLNYYMENKEQESKTSLSKIHYIVLVRQKPEFPVIVLPQISTVKFQSNRNPAEQQDVILIQVSSCNRKILTVSGIGSVWIRSRRNFPRALRMTTRQEEVNVLGVPVQKIISF